MSARSLNSPNLANVTARWPTEGGARRVDDRRVISTIVHMLKWGGRWGRLPGRV
ncbi:IS5/IS1182 family transposase, partial [Pseudomonas sp. AH2 (2023)]|nr:IS5/IS1182 family transposase [Pseudomonas sp. AH2 (2023)]